MTDTHSPGTHSHDDQVKKLAELMKDMRVAMLTTVDADGTLQARPMAVQDVEFAGDLWLFSGKDSPKIAQIERDPHVGVTMQSRDTWISVDGHAEVVDDRRRIHDYWNPFVEAWFPDGPDDPNVTLIKVVGEGAEYWDTPGSAVATAIRFATTKVTGKPYSGGENEKVDL